MQGKVQARYSPEAPHYAVNYNADQTQVRPRLRLRVCAPAQFCSAGIQTPKIHGASGRSRPQL